MEAIIDVRMNEVIEFNDCLIDLISGRGTDAAIIEAKLIQQLAAVSSRRVCYAKSYMPFELFVNENCKL